MNKRGSSKPKVKLDIKGVPKIGLAQVPPSTTPARLLPLHEVQDEFFEIICIDIAEREPDVVQADLKRDRGVEQFGADVEGFSSDHAPILVISAKRYQKVTPATLRSWGTKFLDSFKRHWDGKGVKRFVVAATVELNDDDLNEVIREEKLRFSAIGIAYEAWGLRQLTNKLRGLPRVVATYMHPAWVPIICEPAALSETTIQPRDDRAIANAVTRHAGAEIADAVATIKARYGREIGLQLEEALKSLSEGRAKPLEVLVDRVRKDLITWDSLDGETKAKILRSAGTLALREQNVERAKQLHTEAGIYHPAPDRSAAALLLVSQGDVVGATELLASPGTAEEISIYAGILIEEGHIAEAIEVLQKWPSFKGDPSEFHRLEAFAYSLQRKDDSALASIRQAESLAPRRYAVQWAGGLIRFHAAMSPLLRFQGGSFPNPIPTEMVKEDDLARDLLAEASQIFRQLSEAVDVPHQREELEVWRLASLVCHSGRRGEAETFLQSILARPVPHPGAISWAVQFGLSVKPDPIVKAYTIELAGGRGTSSQVIVAAFLMLNKGSRARALAFLVKWRDAFDQTGDLSLIDHWISQVREMEDAAKPGGEKGEGFQAALKSVYKRRDATRLLTFIDSGTLEPERLLAAFEALLAGRMWKEANDRRDLLTPFKTTSSIEMMAAAACEAGDWENCIQILEGGTSLFPNQVLPRRLRLLEADAKTQMGRPDLALKIIEELADVEQDSSSAAYKSAWLRLRLGDIDGAARQIKGRVVPDTVGVENILQIAHELRLEHPDLARSIVEKITWEKLEKRLVNPALILASELGLAEAQRVLLPKARTAPASRAEWTVDTLEEMLAWLEENRKKKELVFEKLRTSWLNLEIPLHLLFDNKPLELATFFHQPFHSAVASDQANTFAAPLLLRSGHARKVRDGEKTAAMIASQGLILDASGLFIAAELGILDEIDRIGGKILVAPELPEILRSTETALAAHYPPVNRNALHVRDLLRDGEIAVTDDAETSSSPRLVFSNARQTDSDVLLPELLADLVSKGMDRDVASSALERLELAESKPTIHLADDDKVLVSPRELIALADLDLLTPMRTHVQFCVSHAQAQRLRREIDDVQAGVRQTQTLTNLRERVGERLTHGHWTLLPQIPLPDENRHLKESGPLLRGLLSVLSYAERREAPPVWVEDRYVSRFGTLASSAVIDVTDILSVLRASGRIDEKRETNALRSLLKARYGFLLPNASYFVDALLSAPTTKQGIVETDRLIELRTSTAWQLEYGRHLKDVPLGNDIAVGSELMFLSDLMQLAGEVIADIWSRDVPLERKVAAATWAWQHLRLEQVDYLPIADQSPAARENFVAFLYAGLATVVFSIAGSSFRAMNRLRKQYLDWAFATVLNDFASSRPGFERLLVDLAADFINLLFEGSRATDEEDYSVRVAMAGEYVNCFPKRWSALLRQHPLLHDKLKVEVTEVVTIGKLSFSAQCFFAAVAQAFASGKGIAPLRGARRQAIFAPIKAEDAGGTFAFSISDRKSVVSVADDALALLLGDEEGRVGALMRHPDWFDCNGPDLERVARQIASLSTFDERREALRTHQDQTVVFRLEKLGSDIRDGTACPSEVLAPIGTAALRQFLRLPQGLNEFESLAELATKSFKALSAEFGALRALRRVAAIPIELPPGAGVAIAAEARALPLPEVLARIGPTPLASIALWKALCDNGTEVDGFDLQFVFKNVKDSSGLFVSLLQLTFRSVARLPEWAFEGLERSALLWCHANSILDVMLRQGVSVPQTIQLLRGQFRSPLVETFDRARLPGPRMANPEEIRSEYFAALTGWQAWTVSPPESRSDTNLSTLRSLIAWQSGRHYVPIHEFLTYGAFVDVGDSWLCRDIGLEIHESRVAEMPPPFELRNPDEIAQRLLPEIAASLDSEGKGSWSLLWLCDPARLSVETIGAIRKLQTESGLADLVRLNYRCILQGLRYRAQITARLGDQNGFLNDLRIAARHLRGTLKARQRPTSAVGADTPQQRSFTALIEASWAFASVFATDFLDVGQHLKNAVAVIAEEWPESRPACLYVLEVSARQLPTASATPMWDLINQLRRY
ncbi:hypothetical protein N185_16310 [Sinorhizobium sp. GW3]|nr:hypothetical protein N185_16310 [Sinorhizobium sp. GW3]